MDLNRLAELYVSGFWAWAGISLGVSGLIGWVFKFYNRTLRHWNIRKHGYPSGPWVDADGDIVHPKNDQEPPHDR